MANELTIGIVAAYEISALGIRAALERDGNIRVVAEASDSRTAYERLAGCEIEVLVTALVLPGDDGITVAREVRRRSPATRVVIMSAVDRVDVVTYAFEAGASAFVLDSDSTLELRSAVHAAARGELWLSPSIDAAALSEHRRRRERGDGSMPLDPLSPREREVFRLQTRGLSSKEIARELFISDKTVQTHRARIFRKLRLHSAAELVRFAAVHGLMAP